jgi:hypothetical protein
MSAGASAVAASSAAAAARRKMQWEEEEMTGFSPQELSDGWEFKILRSARGAFRDTEKLRQILADEGRAGWILVEKFDNGRIRLKRSARARDMDGKLDMDPYRTCYGPSENKIALVILGITLGSMVALFGLIAIIANVDRNNPPPAMAPRVEMVAPPETSPQKQLP